MDMGQDSQNKRAKKLQAQTVGQTPRLIKRVWAGISHADTAIGWVERLATYSGLAIVGIGGGAAAWYALPEAAALAVISLLLLAETALVLVIAWRRRLSWLALGFLPVFAPLFFGLGWLAKDVLPGIGKLPNRGLFTRWGPGPAGSPPSLDFELDLTQLLRYENKYQIAVVCRAYDASVDFFADPTKQRSEFFTIGTTVLKISMPIGDEMAERLINTIMYECAPVLAPVGEIRKDSKMIYLGDRIGGTTLIRKPSQTESADTVQPP
jgi:hypothetical protein